MKLIKDIKAIAVGAESSESFKIERIVGGKKFCVKARGETQKSNLYDYVYSRGLPVLLREAIDCVKTPWRSLRELMLSAGCTNLYTVNVKNGVVTYKTFSKIRELLRPYKRFLSSWNSFINIYYIPRNQQVVWRTRYAVHTDTLNIYNAGVRSRVCKAAKTTDGNITIFTDFGRGVYVKGDHSKNIVVHNMGGTTTPEGMVSFKEDFKYSQDSVLKNGIEYVLTTKGV